MGLISFVTETLEENKDQLRVILSHFLKTVLLIICLNGIFLLIKYSFISTEYKEALEKLEAWGMLTLFALFLLSAIWHVLRTYFK